MSTANKNRLEVQKILRDNIIAGMTALGYTGWGVMEFANASMQKADKVVLMNLIRNNRVGWQGHRYEDVANAFKRVDEWIDEQSWQLHIICKRTATTTVADVLPEDVADNLITWFNGVGADLFRKSGVAPLRIDYSSVIVYNDNSDLYQKRAVFTVKIQVPKELTTNQDEMTPKNPYVLPNEYLSGVDMTPSAKGFGQFAV